MSRPTDEDPRHPSFDVVSGWHPRWRIWNADGGWWARRRGDDELSAVDERRGVRCAVRASDLASLHEALAAQEVLRDEHTGA